MRNVHVRFILRKMKSSLLLSALYTHHDNGARHDGRMGTVRRQRRGQAKAGTNFSSQLADSEARQGEREWGG